MIKYFKRNITVAMRRDRISFLKLLTFYYILCKIIFKRYFLDISLFFGGEG